VHSISVLAINGESVENVDLVKIVEDASGYFPSQAWDETRYLGKLTLEHDVKILAGKQPSDGFLFKNLIEKLRKIRSALGSETLSHALLLGMTGEPIVDTCFSFDGASYKRIVYLVHDYVTEKVGVVSLFSVNEKFSSKIVAHGLGHNRGLRHHEKPADLMHPELLRLPRLQVEGFCKICIRELTDNIGSG
jgi:hypothetical protein